MNDSITELLHMLSSLNAVARLLVIKYPADYLADPNIAEQVSLPRDSSRTTPPQPVPSTFHALKTAAPCLDVSRTEIEPALGGPLIDIVWKEISLVSPGTSGMRFEGPV
jgi:hypothetical protein